MKSYDFEAVMYDAEIYCIECLPDGVNAEDDSVFPVFADSEWDYYPSCTVCGAKHDYMNLTSDGVTYEKELEDERLERNQDAEADELEGMSEEEQEAASRDEFERKYDL